MMKARTVENKIIIYGTRTCPFCVQARQAYGDRAVFIDVEEKAENLEAMLALSGGKREVPVIVESGRIAVGFQGDVSLRGGIPIFGGT